MLRYLEERVEDYGLGDAAGIENLRFHDLRHACTTNAWRAGVDNFTIMSITGHKTMAVFERYHTIEEADSLYAARRLQEYVGSQDEEGTTLSTA